MNKLAIKTYDIDYSFIIKNYLDVSEWGKEYTLFHYKDIKVSLKMNNIYCDSKSVAFRVICATSTDAYATNSLTLEYYLDHPEYTLDILKNKIYRLIKSTLRMTERDLLRFTDDYDMYDNLEANHKNKIIDECNKYLDELNISNEEIREMYINKQVNEHYIGYANRWRDSQQYKYLTDAWLCLANINDDTDLVEKVLETNDFDNQYYLDLMENIEIEELEL